MNKLAVKMPFRVSPPQENPLAFFMDPEISNYCKNYKAEYIKWAECHNTFDINCHDPEYQGLVTSNSGIQSGIEYFCEREADGYKFDTECDVFQKNPDSNELQECFDQPNGLTTPSTGNITYEGYKYNLCRSRQIGLNCLRNDETFKTECPDTQTTFVTVYEKQIPPACNAGNGDNGGNNGNAIYNTGIWSVIVITYLISLFNN
ncbi:hypothetical protein LOTGIDRAFT_228695 [Lottia gigantea]|uniref:Uncharacterized protein n=1 Tax=Lottia gigantea TaxID=225164 RepID=V4A328_LOTGI|nr:hypothetical protein LOTGIDRAFT_228695 [Lottia gigantea]ESO91112.1 hypothetical protein LOTGIDRAFT_228695 [Lottia gigantea]